MNYDDLLEDVEIQSFVTRNDQYLYSDIRTSSTPR
jgi:hypothetical protein